MTTSLFKAVLFGVAAPALLFSTIPASAAVNQADALKALKVMVEKGCKIKTSSAKLTLSCPNDSVAKLLNPGLSKSIIKVTRSKKATKLSWRLGPAKIQGLSGSQKTNVLKIAGKNIYTYRSTPLDVNVRLQGDLDGAVSAEPQAGGLKLRFDFGGKSVLYCEADIPGPGGFIDSACPDITWENPSVVISAKFAKNLALTDADVKVGGKWAIGGLDKALSDKKMNKAISKAATVAVTTILPTANTVIPLLVVKELNDKYPSLPQDCAKFSYKSDVLKISIPTTDKCMSAIGLG